MEKVWSEKAWQDYLYWQGQDRKTIKKINTLIKEIERTGVNDKPIGKPEKLKSSMHGLSSVKINQKDRLVYKIVDDRLYIVSCRGHYC